MSNPLRTPEDRIPAPNMSFERPNLLALIQEIEALIAHQSE